MSVQKHDIKPIDASSVHRICSGQVILDSSSALKELVENSVDAGSTRIDVRLKEFGLEQLEVSDNGSGIKPEDYELLAIKHTTSKLSNFEDISTLITFGFRGEALSSLCAICEKVTIITRTKDQFVGTKLEYDKCGKLRSASNSARDVGTTITLDGLFQSLPVRYKDFMKNKTREYQRLLRRLQAYALIHTGVRFSCSNQGAKGRTNVLTTPGNGRMLDAVTSIFGARMKDLLTDVDIKIDDQISMQGMISKASSGNGLSSTDRQFMYLNKRPVDIPKIAKVINEVYKSFNMHQYPIYVLNITMPPDWYDVNVTPDKRQVMIHKEKALVERVKDLLKDMFEPSRGTMVAASTQAGRLRNAADATDKSPFMQDILLEHQNEGSESLENSSTKDVSKQSSTCQSGSFPVLNNEKNDVLCTENEAQVQRSAEDNDADDIADLGRSQEGDNIDSMDISSQYEDAPAPLGSRDSDRRSRSSRTVAAPSRPSEPTASGSIAGLARLSRSKTRIEQPKISSFLSQEDKMQVQGKRRARVAAESEDEREHSSDERGNRGVAAPDHKDPKRRRSGLRGETEKAEVSSTLKDDRAYDDTATDGAPTRKNKCRPDNTATADDRSICAEDEGDVIEGREAAATDLVKGEDSACTGTTTISLDVDWDTILDQAAAAISVEDIIAENPGKSDMSSLQGGADESASDLQMRVISKEDFLEMSILGQFNLGFIIAELRGDLYILDQHACDEKYRFETLQQALRMRVQPLVAPKRMEIEPADELVVQENLEVLLQLIYSILTPAGVIDSSRENLGMLQQLIYSIITPASVRITCYSRRQVLQAASGFYMRPVHMPYLWKMFGSS